MPTGRRIIADLRQKLLRAEREADRLAKAYAEGRGSRATLAYQRKCALSRVIELGFAIDTLRQAYERRPVPVLNQHI